jgi:hypothetical protein
MVCSEEDSGCAVYYLVWKLRALHFSRIPNVKEAEIMKKLLVLAMVLSMTLGMVAVGHADVASDRR